MHQELRPVADVAEEPVDPSSEGAQGQVDDEKDRARKLAKALSNALSFIGMSGPSARSSLFVIRTGCPQVMHVHLIVRVGLDM